MKSVLMRTLALAGALTVALTASAQSGDELERAKASFKAGAAAYGAGDYPAAIEALATAYEITPLPAIAFSLAQAERRQYFATHERGHMERAIALFRRYVEQVESGGRRPDALDALAQLEPLAVREGIGFAQGAAETLRPAEGRRTRLMIRTVPASARVSIDGSEAQPAPVIREVAATVHRVRVEADGYFPVEREVTAVASELVLAEITLRERPALLRVTTPEDALIYVDGRFARYGGDDVQLELAPGVHRLTVASAGHATRERAVVLAHGERAAVRLDLDRTPRRNAARVLALVGAATLATGVVLGGLAIRREHTAEDFLARRARENVSAAQLGRYHDDLDARDRLRTSAIATTAAAVGALLAALLLQQLDRPDLRAIDRGPIPLDAEQTGAPLAPALGSRAPTRRWLRAHVQPLPPPL